MRSQFLSWWQKIKERPISSIIIFIAIIVVIALIVVITLGYRFNWAWTGLGPYTPPTKDSSLQRGKTLWDWLQLFVIPVALAIGGYWYSRIQKRNEQKIAQDNQQETALQAYIDKVSELLLHERLGELSTSHVVVIIARARTATTLRMLDPIRRASLILFLSQSGILAICVENSSKSSFDLPLNNENSLESIDLQETNLNGANLSMLHVEKANLQKSSLRMANLQETDLSGANLQKANLSHADLRKARLWGANLQGARLFDANLQGAVLIGANLERANLHSAVITQEQLKEFKSLRGAIMPDGSKHP